MHPALPSELCKLAEMLKLILPAAFNSIHELSAATIGGDQIVSILRGTQDALVNVPRDPSPDPHILIGERRALRAGSHVSGRARFHYAK